MEPGPRRPGERSYRLLTQSLREQIFRDAYPEGTPLPTELSLAKQHGLSRQTVRRAFQELVAEGWQALRDVRELADPGLHTQTTVIGLIESRGRDIAEAEQVITATAADGALAADLACAAGIPILHIERTYLDRKGEPLEYAVSDFLPAHYSHRSRLGRSVEPFDGPAMAPQLGFESAPPARTTRSHASTTDVC